MDMTTDLTLQESCIGALRHMGVEVTALVDKTDRLEAENAKLRELVRDMWFWGYCGHMDSESQEWQMKHIDGVLDRMRKLGIEANE